MRVDPDGININAELRRGASRRDFAQPLCALAPHVGIALDGDGDRVMIIDERGEVFDGDDVMALLGCRLAAEGRLNGNAVVATVMSNFGLEKALARAGVRLIRTEVGDPAVVREMRAEFLQSRR